MSGNASNRSLKKDFINGYGFWAMCLPKIDTYINLKFGSICLGMVLQHIVLLKSENLDFVKSYLKISVFSMFGE